MVILAPGPSYNYLTHEEKKYIFSNYLTTTIKYVIDDLIENNLIPNFFIYNQSSSKFSIEYYQEKASQLTSFIGTNKQYTDLFKFNISIGKRHIDNFNSIRNGEDKMSWDINKFKDNELFFYKMHIMCELAIPLAIHLGIKISILLDGI